MTPGEHSSPRIGILRNPIVIICLWWTGILLAANLVRIGNGIQPETNLVVFLFILSVFSFGVYFSKRKPTCSYSVPGVFSNYPRIWMGLAILVYICTLVLGVVGYKLQELYGNEFRALVFGAGGYDSLLYGSYYIQVMAGFILAPMLLLGVIAFPVAGVFFGKFRYVVLGFIFCVAADFQTAGRFYTYFFLLSILLAYLFMRKVSPKFRLRLALSSLLMVVPLFISSARRAQVYEYNPEVVSHSIDQAIEYHLIGIHLLNADLANKNSVIHKTGSFGRLSLLSYPDNVICMVLRRFGVHAIPAIDEMAVHWQDNVWIGNDRSGSSHEVNAYYTSLYPMYYDFGLLGVILIPGALVFFLVRHYQVFLRFNNFASLLCVVFLTLFFVTSIFNSKLTSVDFVTLFCSMFLLRRVSVAPTANCL